MTMRGIVILVLAAAAVAPATEQVVLETDGDSYVRYYWCGEGEVEYIYDNFGHESLMWVLYYRDEYGDYPVDIEIAYMHFDFSGLGEYDGADLVEAQLVFFAQTPVWEQRAYTVKSAWHEMTITYNNRPGAGTWLASFYMDVGDNCVDLDVTPIAPWVDAPETAYGILIWDNSGSDCVPGKIYTRETEYVPELRLTFSGPAVQGASWGEIKAAFE